MRVKCNFDFDHLAYLFGVKTRAAGRAFHFILWSLDRMFRHEYFNLMASEKLENAPGMECMKDYPNCLIVLDGSEFFIQTPRLSAIQKLTWSTYKHHHTIKVLVGINRAGQVVFVSNCHPGRISDKQLITYTHVLEQLPPGSAVMVDKGFLIADIASKYGVEVVMPPLASSAHQFSKEDLNKGRKIASTRIHIERAIERAKSFHILAEEINNGTLLYISPLVRICFLLTNLTGDLVLDVPETAEEEGDGGGSESENGADL
jgi:DDE superfamily endonuclease